jgi:SAM-dependent methyltransferase
MTARAVAVAYVEAPDQCDQGGGVALADEVTTFVGHRIHLVRSREVPRLLDWIGRDVAGSRILDVAGGDGYWAVPLVRRGASVVSLDIARHKLIRGQRLRDAPALVEADALALPFGDASFDVVMSVCALEHFSDVSVALAEMARVLRPGGRVVMSVDALTHADRYPELVANHKQRYHVQQTFRRESLATDLRAVGLDVTRATYLFRGANERIYLGASHWRQDWSWNALAPLAPFTALVDRLHADDGGAILLVDAVKGTS